VAGATRLKVCHIASGDRWAGAEAQIAMLLGRLSRQPALDLCAIFLNPGRLAEAVRSFGVETRIIPEIQRGLLAIAREATEFLRVRNVQILHSHRYKENLLAGLLARRCRIPFVVETLHGLPEPQTGLKSFRQRLIHQLDRWVARLAADRVISVSPEMTQNLRGQLPPHKLVTIINGIDLGSVRSKLSAAEAKARLGIPSHHRVLGVAGRLEPIKRLDIFLHAAARLSAANAPYSFVIAGEGRERVRLKQLAGKLGIGGQVLFLGQRDDIYDVLRAFDILVICSDHEGLPMVLLEALALGLVVVARDVGGVPEVIRDGENGILVSSDDPTVLASACLEVLADSSRSRRLAESGPKSVAEKFTIDRTATQVAELYRSLVEPK